MTAAARPTPRLSWRARATMFARLFAVQGSWSYELMDGPGLGFCEEPALRELPGGRDGAPYRAALARQTRFFNSHPYLAAVAVGAMARAELAGEPPEQIERVRAAMCGPLGSLGDRLVWAGWLPFCAFAALLVFGAQGGPLAVVLVFLVLYNVGHIGLRAWGLQVGWRHGLRVTSALGAPILHRGPQYLARAVMLLAGIAIPLDIARLLDRVPGTPLRAADVPAAVILLATAALGVLLTRVRGRAEGWRAALLILAALILASIAR